MTGQAQFRFRKLDSVGSADASEDSDFLAECFVDTGDLAVLRDCADPRRLVVGRTGSGKAALLDKLGDSEERVIRIQPEALALSYISNSTILSFIQQLGVRLDIFFRLLWRHVLTVEVLRTHFHIDTPEVKATVVTRLKSLFGGKKEGRALEYLEKWGKTFWLDTDYRIRELTTTLESELKASIKAGVPSVGFEVGSAKKLTEEQKREVIHRAQQVINQVQIQELSYVLDLLAKVVADPQKRYFVVIDRLDEEWIEERLKYPLIRALLETARDFRKVRQAKVVVALRWDLIDRVFRITRDSGFQEEKYESLYLGLAWSRSQLTQLLDARIDRLVRSRYTKGIVTHRDLLPSSVDGRVAIEYMLERTMMRPRDLILFFNACIGQAEGKPVISGKMLKQAEGEYSRARLRSLADEWFADYPNLIHFADLLKTRRAWFLLDSITNDECIDFAVKLLTSPVEAQDVLAGLAAAFVDCTTSADDFRRGVISVFYKVGIVGLKLEGYEGVNWSTGGRRSVSSAEIGTGVKVWVHPCFWRALGIVARSASPS